jgi:dTDP-4-dehydrorhamnose 3,5-epimerase
MKVTPLALPEVLSIEPLVHRDARGAFMESWHMDRYRAAGIPERFVQDNLSRSRRGVLRGLHLQEPYAQGKLVSVPHGEVFDVAVDVRLGSPTFGRWVGCILSAENGRQLYIPEGFAHGFVVTSETALFSYKCTSYYHPGAQVTLLWNDPDIGIRWPVDVPVLSNKDRAGLCLREIPFGRLPSRVSAA